MLLRKLEHAHRLSLVRLCRCQSLHLTICTVYMYCASLDAVCAAVFVLQGECRGTNLGPVGGAAVNKEATAPQQRVSNEVVHAPLLLISTLSWQVCQTDLSAVLCEVSPPTHRITFYWGNTLLPLLVCDV